MTNEEDKNAVQRGSVYTARIQLRIRRALLRTGKFKLKQLDKYAALLTAEVVDELIKMSEEKDTDEKTT